MTPEQRAAAITLTDIAAHANATRAEQDAEDRARSDEQDKDRRVWSEVYP